MICYCCGYLLNMFVTNRFVFDFKITPELLIAKNTFLYGFELFPVFMVINIFNWYKGIGKNPKKLMQVKDGNQNEIYTGLEQAHFETQKESVKKHINKDSDCGINYLNRILKTGKDNSSGLRYHPKFLEEVQKIINE